jgi:hypothetical protein
MQSPERAPMRTEADVRAALAELARRAPAADAVLSEMREAGLPRRRGSPEVPGPAGWPGRPRLAGLARALTPRLGWPQLVVGAVAAVTAMALALVLTPGGPPTRTRGPGELPAVGSLPSPSAVAPPGGPSAVVSPGRHPSAASLARAMLTAFNAAADDLAYEMRADFTNGRIVNIDRSWSWPALPSPGQLEYVRDAYSAVPPRGSKATAPLKLTEDEGYTTVVPHPSRYLQRAPARLIVVCYAGTGQTGCGWGPFNTPAGTWSMHTGTLAYEDYTPAPRGADFARQIARGEWRIIGHTRLRGQQAIKLAETRSGQIQGRPVFLWVSTATYLPLRMVSVFGRQSVTDNWYYLPPTKANLAQLRVPIPAGYPRSG